MACVSEVEIIRRTLSKEQRHWQCGMMRNVQCTMDWPSVQCTMRKDTGFRLKPKRLCTSGTIALAYEKHQPLTIHQLDTSIDESIDFWNAIVQNNTEAWNAAESTQKNQRYSMFVFAFRKRGTKNGFRYIRREKMSKWAGWRRQRTFPRHL